MELHCWICYPLTAVQHSDLVVVYFSLSIGVGIWVRAFCSFLLSCLNKFSFQGWNIFCVEYLKASIIFLSFSLVYSVCCAVWSQAGRPEGVHREKREV